MERICFLMRVAVLFVLVNTTVLQAQVGIGTLQPDSSAALEINSSNKGLLIPRVDLAANNIPLPATALMVFNTNPNYDGGAGIYINMGTGAQPQWTQLVPANAGGFIRNQTTPQPQSNFNITGNGEIAGNLDVRGISMRPENTGNTTVFGAWRFRHLGPGSISPGSFTLGMSASTVAISVLRNGFVGINRVEVPTEALQVNGNIKASGNVIVDVEYVRRDVTIGGHLGQSFYMDCPAGKKVIGGGGGHRDLNTAMYDIQVHYSGPDPSANGNRWRFFIHNDSGSSRALLLYCVCAKVQ
ncbi:hypothetical protein D3H65_08210 [Paraflavitalea soli]|uniref:Uncharacterized protein n=1 Tax=Paraflavitalea soli TaxID=2315862 RepID=A0A3B7MLY2_9BACT|nr:hypothetical protein [Paraflavitalea soli]AXY73966.1 hypothetical protein D3H65_08210 [Paraflavitalea soli]